MKQIIIYEPGNLSIEEVPIPEIKLPGDVLIKVKAAGICGSDMHIYHGTSPVAVYPRIIGHEVVGIVEAVGPGVSSLQTGDHVIVDPVVSCGSCPACLKNRGNVCENLVVKGVHQDGGFREYLVADQKNVYSFSGKLSFEEAVLIEPFSVAAQVCSRGGITPDDTVFIMGAGVIGQSVLMVAKKMGAGKIIISDIASSKLEKAEALGAHVSIDVSKEDALDVIMKETGGKGVSVIIDCVCTTRSFQDSLKYASTAATIVVLGFTDEPSLIPQLNITAKELDIRGSRLHNKMFPKVIEWFNNGEINAKALISDHFHFTKIMDAIEKIEDRSRDTEKVILTFD